MAGIPAVPEMRLELVPVPVSDVDRAKELDAQVGFGNLHDTQVTETMRVVQLTPPGSSCAIVFGTGMGPITDMVPGSVKGLHLVVEDMAATRVALTDRGIELSDVDDMGGVLYCISVIRMATCGRFSSGPPVTRHSSGDRPNGRSARKYDGDRRWEPHK